MSTYITALIAGPVPRGPRQLRRSRRRDPARAVLPHLAGPVPRRRRDLRGHQAGLRLLPPDLRLPLPVRQVRPALRARVQRRRDGERRRGHLPRGLRLPVEGHRRRLRASRRDDPARDGAHVVRRPRHHALVGRPVAQRVVRHLHGVLCQTEATRWTDAWTTFANAEKTWAYRQDQLPSTHPIVGRHRRHRGRARSTSTASPTPRAPRCSSSSSPGSAATSSSPACAATSSATRGATPRCATCSTVLEDCLAAATCRPGRRSGSRPPASTRCARRSRSTPTGCSPRSRSSRRRTPDHPTLRSHRLAIGLYDLGPDGARPAASGSSSTSSGASTEVPELVGARQPDLVLVNDDDLTYAKIRLDERSLATVDHVDRRVHRVAAPRAVLDRRLGHDPRRRDGGPRLPPPGARRAGQRDRHRRGAVAAAPGPARRRTLRQPGPARGRAAPARTRPAAT